jgi:hypothetical protein
MTVKLDLSLEVEKSLSGQAQERGVSLSDYLQEIVNREARLAVPSPSATTAGNLSDLLLHSPFAGANLDLERLSR